MSLARWCIHLVAVQVASRGHLLAGGGQCRSCGYDRRHRNLNDMNVKFYFIQSKKRVVFLTKNHAYNFSIEFIFMKLKEKKVPFENVLFEDWAGAPFSLIICSMLSRSKSDSLDESLKPLANGFESIFSLYQLILVCCHSYEAGLRKNERFVLKSVQVRAHMQLDTALLRPFDQVNPWLILNKL
ncbi:hypothetical protein BpHYR1_020580 [Brachionus plicatilis]|uniref:Uncharacterized protein n=1 Tax=Brachionus plicatilis TaxID=10195 RepID=A0A3M7PIL8_BRAPC|nr:hypothetical protein BpHYR1_020580 [Brachionus plicatilis]